MVVSGHQSEVTGLVTDSFMGYLRICSLEVKNDLLIFLKSTSFLLTICKTVLVVLR